MKIADVGEHVAAGRPFVARGVPCNDGQSEDLSASLTEADSPLKISEGHAKRGRRQNAKPGPSDQSPSPGRDLPAEARNERRSPPVGITPADILDRWLHEGPLVRVPTGIAALDEACRGGLPIPWRMIIVGAPSAGKTAMQIVIADHLARALGAAGAYVGILAVDEDPDDLLVRLLQIAGFTVAEAEARAPDMLARMDEALKTVNVRLYDAQHTIESAAADLALHAHAAGRQAALFIDSMHSVRSATCRTEATGREIVDANGAAIRQVATQYRMLVVTTAEANRASYRQRKPGPDEQMNDLAAGAESRVIEYVAQTQLVLRTPPDHPDIVHVRVAKNRRAIRGVEFWLRLDREAHSLTECEAPTETTSQGRGRPSGGRARTDIEDDARALSKLVAENPRLSVRKLREKVGPGRLGWGIERLNKAVARLKEGVDGFRLANEGVDQAKQFILQPMGDDDAPHL
jgi:KaiC/GvpD/RAD55 family RecA-like ATPase